MTTLPISDIIRDSFALAWRYKYLWLFGLFASGGGGGLQFPGGDSGTGLERIEEIQAWVLAAMAMIILVGLVIGTIVLILHTFCKTALIYNVYQIETGGAHSLSGGWDFAVKRFWPMLGLTVTQWFVLFAFAVILILVEVILFATSLALGFLSLLFALPAFFAGLAIGIVVWGYAERFIALENRGVIEALGEGWTLAKTEWRATVTVLLIKIAITIAFAIVAGLGGLALVLPAVGIWAASKPLAILYGILVIVPYLILVGGFVGTFDYAVWTKVFLRLRATAYGTANPTVAPTKSSDDSTPQPMFE